MLKLTQQEKELLIIVINAELKAGFIDYEQDKMLREVLKKLKAK